MADAMNPFADDRSTLSVGGLTAENGTDRINISGSIDITKDHRGLDHARALRSLLTAVVSSLEAENDLPAKAAVLATATTSKKPNPFE